MTQAGRARHAGHHRRVPVRVHRPRALRHRRTAAAWTTTPPWSSWPAPPSPTPWPAQTWSPLPPMMDGQVKAIRTTLDQNRFKDVPIIALRRQVRPPPSTAPSASPRSPPPSFGDRRRLPDGPGQPPHGHARDRAGHRGGRRRRHGQAGPCLPGRDSQGKRQLQLPNRQPNNVSGEFLHAEGRLGATAGWTSSARPSRCSPPIKRAGADVILSYYAKDVARWLREGASL